MNGWLMWGVILPLLLVVAAALVDADGRVLVQQRPPGIANFAAPGRNEVAGPEWRDDVEPATYPGYRFPAEVTQHADQPPSSGPGRKLVEHGCGLC